MADPILHPDSDRLRDPVDAPALEALEEGRLSRGFVDQIGDRLDNGDDEAVRALVVPLRPADIAELFAMVAEADRTALARAIGDAL
ncbi:MAG: magnesium transporter, partial [Polymorphobacter sp.]